MDMKCGKILNKADINQDSADKRGIYGSALLQII
jgi:hypothetical protein